IYDRFRLAWERVEAGESLNEAVRAATGQEAKEFFPGLFTFGEAVPGEIKAAEAAHLGIKVAAVAGLATLTLYALTHRNKPSGEITGLADTGMSADSRHKHSDFGSGWRGKDRSQSLRAAEIMLAGGALYGAHRLLLDQWGEYG